MKDHRQQPLSAAKEQPDSQLALGMSLGTCLGVSLGVALDDLGMWLPLGIALGLAMGSFIDLIALFGKKKDKPAGPLIRSHPDRHVVKS